MLSGRFRHTVTLQSPTEDLDSSGLSIFQDELDVKAEIRALSVHEQFTAAQEHASATHRISFRFRPSLDGRIKGSWRVKFGERIFILVGLPDNVDERNREIQLLCDEGPKTE